MLCDLIYRLRLHAGAIDGWFLNYFLGTECGRAQIESDARGSSGSMVKVSQEHIKDWWIPRPPLSEQSLIVVELAGRLAPYTRLAQAAERTISLLKERRSALIAAAVTGKIPIPPEPVP
jgi:type I restriction enzyme S subunit